MKFHSTSNERRWKLTEEVQKWLAERPNLKPIGEPRVFHLSHKKKWYFVIFYEENDK